jgi:hypothetical protein
LLHRSGHHAVGDAGGCGVAALRRTRGDPGLAEEWKSRPPGEGYRPRTSFAQHCLSTSRIDFAGPRSAQAQTYWFVLTDVGPDHAGYYLDDFEEVGGRWLIAWRRVRKRWHDPESVFVAAGTAMGHFDREAPGG